MTVTILQGDVRDMLRTLPAESVQCVVTSPPYFQLRDYGVSGQIGLEKTPAEFIAALVDVFREVRRVLRPDGVVFCNIGDSYAGSGKGTPGPGALIKHTERQGFTGAGADARNGTVTIHQTGQTYGIPAKNLLLIPQRFAIAMQDSGWIVRSQIAWCKTSAMPESVRDRPTSAWEPIWMFTKSARYFWDQEAVRQPNTSADDPRNRPDYVPMRERNVGGRTDGYTSSHGAVGWNPAGANLRNFWLLGPEPLREAHFAAFPSEIPRRCILAATSEKGQCPTCGSPWVRVVERERGIPGEVRGYQAGVNGTTPNVTHGKGSPNAVVGANYMQMTARGGVRSETTGWQPSCQCDAGDPVPQLVLDPFLGSGTTALVADQLGRNAIGCELNPTYAEMARRRIAGSAPMFADVAVVDDPQQLLMEPAS